jgi:hypothetical protein
MLDLYSAELRLRRAAHHSGTEDTERARKKASDNSKFEISNGLILLKSQMV